VILCAVLILGALPAIADDVDAYWVFFADRGRYVDASRAQIRELATIDELAIRRRARRGHVEGPDAFDLPPDPGYLRRLRERGLTVRLTSRWLNAVSVLGLDDPIALAAEPWVERCVPVGLAAPRAPNASPRGDAHPNRDDPHDYGLSAPLLHQIGVPPLHERGLTGHGVRVGVIDSGFCLLHPAFDRLEVADCWDFINDDSLVCNEPGEPCEQHRHGTMVLSALAGSMPGQLMGPAFDATFLLAKTEEVDNDDHVEEDRWVAALEWMEARGVDVVSSSLCFYQGYDMSDLDGDSAPASVAADHAACLGVLVCNAAGNRREDLGHVGVPADGDRVIAVGGVDEDGDVTDFSAPGPTSDDRIKPDIAARAVDVPVADADGDYCLAWGTSLSTPLVAGLAALLVQADPDATPCQLGWALKLSADHAGDPNNDVGWGVPDGALALAILEGGIPPEGATPFRLFPASPNPFRESTTLRFALDRKMHVTLVIYDVRGRRVRTLVDRAISAGQHCFCWHGKDDTGKTLAAGTYLAQLNSGARRESVKLHRLR